MTRSISCALAGAASIGLAAGGSLLVTSYAQAAGTTRAAYVETVIPSKPFSALVIASPGVSPFVGPSTGVFGVTSLTLSNSTSRSSGVTLNVVAVPDGIDCERASFAHGIILFRAAAYVPSLQTLQLVYPSPWVIGSGLSVPAGQHACLATEVLDSASTISVHISGLIN